MPYGTAHITWSPNVEADLAGYRIYYGTSPTVLSFTVDVGMTATPLAPETTLTTFQAFGVLYFAVTAYDTSNNESGFSDIKSKGLAPFLLPTVWP